MANKCLGRAKDMITIQDLNFKAVSSSEIWGGKNTPSQPINGKDGDSWMSRPGH